MVLTSINPATGETLKTFKEWTTEKIKKQIMRSSRVFDQWSNTDYSERKKLLQNTAILLRNNKQNYAQLMTLEMGKPIVQSEAEIEKCAWVCDYYVEHGARFLETEPVQTDADRSYVRFSPLGTILAVMPWNFPFWQVIRCAAPVLMAGNVIMLKHSSNVPQCALALDELFEKAGFPDNVFRSLLVESKAVENIIRDERVVAVTLTGSSDAGRQVAEIAGRYLKKIVLELGGSDPFIVLQDADIEYTAEQAVKARMINSGQSCIAAKRFIVIKDVFDAFQDIVVEKVKHLAIGDPMERSTEVGPLARKDILEQVDVQVKKSVRRGARVCTGGKRWKEHRGYFYVPTVLSNIHQGMPVYNEEVFGPILSLIKVRDEREAVNIANDSSFGLGASIWTRNTQKGEDLSRRIQAGMIFVNEIVKSDPRLPFGGIKKSGYGRELSHFGIKEFVNIQTMYMKKQGRP